MKSILTLVIISSLICHWMLAKYTLPSDPLRDRTSALTFTYKKNAAFINGQVFDGLKFVARDFYSTDGVISFHKPFELDTTIDLQGRFVVPPFGEAHNHNLGDPSNFEGQMERHLKAGIFYSKNLHYIHERTLRIMERAKMPETVDVAFAHAGIIASGGHVHALYQNLYKWDVLPEFKSTEEMDTRAYMIVDRIADLDAKWSTLLSMNPDIIKTYLEYSGEFDMRKSDPQFVGERGLDPEILKEIVRRSHAIGKRVSTHIESKTDFHNAVLADVDEIAHLPGYRISPTKNLDDYAISEMDAIQAAQKGIFVITTTALSAEFTGESRFSHNDIRQIQRDNLNLLKEQGVSIVFGIDITNKTVIDEVLYVKELGVFTNLELLNMLCEFTPKNIFPDRKIGRLLPGYEASFIVLHQNPLEDIDSITGIYLRYKQGYFLVFN